MRDLTFRVMLFPADRDQRDAGAADHDALDPGLVHVVAAGQDQVLEPVDHEEPAGSGMSRDVLDVQSPVRGDGLDGGIGVVFLAQRD